MGAKAEMLFHEAIVFNLDSASIEDCHRQDTVQMSSALPEPLQESLLEPVFISV